MRIVLDGMGSDDFPHADVAGAVLAARVYGFEVVIVGDEGVIGPVLAGHDTAGLSLSVHHAPEAINMEDKPRDVVRGKRGSSMHVGMQLVKDGVADAFVTAGNTGAALAIAMLGPLRRIAGVKRPGMGVRFPVPSRPFLIDNGTNTDCTPAQLLQFAQMGSIYVSHMNGVARPCVALLSNGEEDGKGNGLLREAAVLLRESGLNYVGYIEPRGFMRGEADVVVTDGFVGNVMMKTAEATGRFLVELIRQEIGASWRGKLGGLLARPALRRVALALDADEVGGAPILGVDGVVVIAHGRSNGRAIQHAIRQAHDVAQADVVERIRAALN